MGRFDTRFRRPPVKIGGAQARVQQGVLLRGASKTAMGAGGFGSREARNESVDIALRIRKGGVGPTLGAAKPIGRTQRKRGYPPIPVAAASIAGK